eukprot:m.341117 g.341117  ORF g.341117 m.341117 type:complete len:308 (-) comp20606_c0_seq3:389-1312(-)
MWESTTLALYFVILGLVILRHPNMFSHRYGRQHRIAGGIHLVWLVVGVGGTLGVIHVSPFLFDVCLSISGIFLTLTAANDFAVAHAKVRNPASGALEQDKTVSVSEMQEHVFYQGLNLIQILYLHWSAKREGSRAAYKSYCALFLVSSPWLFRKHFPVNSFSRNYANKTPTPTGIMYRLKKYQYLLYKHVLLHGLNISVVLSTNPSITQVVADPRFRLYWIGLNTAYVMEFFLQTLVKRKYMAQSTMLGLNQLLMVVSTAAALDIVLRVNMIAAITSLALNFINRGHDVINVGITTMLCMLAAAAET